MIQIREIEGGPVLPVTAQGEQKYKNRADWMRKTGAVAPRGKQKLSKKQKAKKTVNSFREKMLAKAGV